MEEVFIVQSIMCNETIKCGGQVEASCINQSDHPNIIIGTTIYLGLGYLKNLEHYTIKRLLTERNFNGPYISLDDFIDRVQISIEQLTILIRIGAFRFTGISKATLLWHAIFKLNANKQRTVQKQLSNRHINLLYYLNYLQVGLKTHMIRWNYLVLHCMIILV